MSLQNQLEQLKQFTTVVSDTGDFDSIQTFTPQDATTNPSLIYKAAQKSQYQPLVEQAIRDHVHSNLSGRPLHNRIMDELLVLFGVKILEIVPGRVSTEVDARLSFDRKGTIEKARFLIALYETKGIPRERVLIKIASTWEGIRASEILTKEGIRCNMTLLFSMAQAIACAEASVQLISPFVGRIYDWYQNKGIEGNEDPGVQSVQQIYTYYKQFEYSTEIMGASFRNKEQVLALAGCDLLTISPALLEQLRQSTAPVTRRLSPGKSEPRNTTPLDEKTFRWQLNEDPMATEKTAEGIRLFAADIEKLESEIAQRLCR